MRTLVSLAALGIILSLVHVASDVITPFLIGTVLAVAFQPLSSALDRRGLPPIVAALITTLIVVGFVAIGGFLVYVAASSLAADLPAHGRQLAVLRDDAAQWLQGRGLEDSARSLRELSFGAQATTFASNVAMRATSFAQSLFFVLIVTAFIQLEATGYHKKLARVLGGMRKTRWLTGALHEIQRYLIAKLALSAANGLLLGLWCYAWGIESPLLWGLLAFALNFIPFIGSTLAAIPPVVLGFMTGGTSTALGVAAGYLLVNLFVDNIIEPTLLGRTIGLSPLVLLLAMLVWGLVLGPVGAMLSVPLTMAVKLALERDPELRKIAVLMSSPHDLPPPGMLTGPMTAVSPPVTAPMAAVTPPAG